MDAFYNVTVVELEALLSNDKFLASERRAPRQLVIDNVIQLFCGVVQQAKLVYNLQRQISDEQTISD